MFKAVFSILDFKSKSTNQFVWFAIFQLRTWIDLNQIDVYIKIKLFKFEDQGYETKRDATLEYIIWRINRTGLLMSWLDKTIVNATIHTLFRWFGTMMKFLLEKQEKEDHFFYKITKVANVCIFVTDTKYNIENMNMMQLSSLN